MVPIAVWAATLFVVIGLFQSRARQVAVFGLVQGHVFNVETTCTGRIVAIPVHLHETVKQGQTVAIVNILQDDQHVLEQQLKSQLQTISAQIQHLAAQLIPTHEGIVAESSRNETRHADDQRRFATDVDNARLKVLELRAQIETDRMTARTLEADVAVAQKLVDANAIVAFEAEKLQLQHDTVRTAVRENEALLEQAQANLAAAQERLTSFSAMTLEHPSPDNAVEVIRKEIAVNEGLINEVTAQLKALQEQRAFEIRSPLEGIVSRIDLGPGDVADVNMPILRIAQAEPTEVLGYLRDTEVSLVREGMDVDIVKVGTSPLVCRAQVVSLGPVVEMLPQQLWFSPTIPQWGRPFLVRAPMPIGLLVGEKVGIRGI